MPDLTEREMFTLHRIDHYETLGGEYDGLPAYTRTAVLRKLLREGLVDLRVTAKGYAVLDREPRKRYAAQVRPADGEWTTAAHAHTEHDAADALWATLQRAGFRTGELADHVADLARGHELTAEDGTAYRVVLDSVSRPA